MTDAEMREEEARIPDRLTKLARQGQSWKAIEHAMAFKRPAPLFDQPLEITIQMLRGLRMVDETIVVIGDVAPPASEADNA